MSLVVDVWKLVRRHQSHRDKNSSWKLSSVVTEAAGVGVIDAEKVTRRSEFLTDVRSEENIGITTKTTELFLNSI